MINLIKHQNKNSGKVLLSSHGKAEMQESGLLIKFPSADNRKPHHAITIDNESLTVLVDEILEYLRK